MRIVRKVDSAGYPVAFWIDSAGALVCWADGPMLDQEIADDGGWIAEEQDAAEVGTTLSALHQELTEGGEG